MFGVFKSPMGHGNDDNGHHMSGAEMTMAPVKIGGHEFMPDSQGTQAFNAWVKSAKANNEMIQVGTDPTNHVEINTMAGKMEIVKAQLQLKGLSEAQAIDAIKAVKTQLQPAKPFIVYKAKATDDAPPNADAPQGPMIKAGKAQADGPKEARTFRSPHGPVTVAK